MGLSSITACRPRCEKRFLTGAGIPGQLYLVQGHERRHRYYVRRRPGRLAVGLLAISLRPQGEWGPTYFDATHMFNFSHVYELPVGKGRAFGENLHPVLMGVVATGRWAHRYVPFRFPADHPGSGQLKYQLARRSRLGRRQRAVIRSAMSVWARAGLTRPLTPRPPVARSAQPATALSVDQD